MTATRQKVYEAIDSERDYQDTLARNRVNRPEADSFSPITNLAIIEELCARMRAEFYDKPGHPDPAFMRKIAATAVRTMETFGAPLREPAEEKIISAYEQGYTAWNCNILREWSPFPPGSEQEDWLQGWDDAAAELGEVEDGA